MTNQISQTAHIAKHTVSSLANNNENDPYFKPVEKTIWQKIAKYKTFYLMLTPAILFFIVFSYWPMTGNILAFRKFSFNSGMYGKG